MSIVLCFNFNLKACRRLPLSNMPLHRALDSTSTCNTTSHMRIIPRTQRARAPAAGRPDLLPSVVLILRHSCAGTIVALLCPALASPPCGKRFCSPSAHVLPRLCVRTLRLKRKQNGEEKVRDRRGEGVAATVGQHSSRHEKSSGAKTRETETRCATPPGHF